MTRPITWGCWGLLVLVLTSCASPQACFLRAERITRPRPS